MIYTNIQSTVFCDWFLCCGDQMNFAKVATTTVDVVKK